MEKKSIKQGVIIILFIFSCLYLVNSYDQVNEYVLDVNGENNYVDEEFNVVTYNSYILQVIESMALVITTFTIMLLRLGEYSFTEEIKQWINK